MGKPRDLANVVATGNILADGAVAPAELTGVTSTAAELNILDGVTATAAELNLMDGVTATTAELNYVDGVTSNVQTQIDTKAPVAGPTFTGTLAAPTINASTALQIGGAAITATAAELNKMDGVTVSASDINTVTAKLPLSGGTMTGDIAHASNFTIDVGGNIILDADGGQIVIKDGGTQIANTLANNGGDLELYLETSNKVLKFGGNDGGSPITALTLDMSAAGAATFNSTVTATGATINGTLDIEEVYEKVATNTGTSGTLTFNTNQYAVEYYTANQTANRTINFSAVNSNLAVGQSLTCAVLLTQGSTAYYLNAYQVDGSSVTPKWSGGTAPTGGNASSIDAYSFTIIKTADATFTVLASVTQFA